MRRRRRAACALRSGAATLRNEFSCSSPLRSAPVRSARPKQSPLPRPQVEGLIPVLSERGLLPGRLPPGESLQSVREGLSARAHTDFLRAASLAFLSGEGGAA